VHREFVVAALHAGKHVFCETPLALTQEDAQAMLDAAEANDRLLLVGLLMRSIAAYQYIKRALEVGQVGKPVAAYAHRPGSYLRLTQLILRNTTATPTEQMTFDFDALNWLLGSLRSSGPLLLDSRTPSGHVFASLRYSNTSLRRWKPAV
jgi:predicted dehydrogenase